MKKFYNLKKQNMEEKLLIMLISNFIFGFFILSALALMCFSLCIIECEVVGTSMQPNLNAKGGQKSDIAYVNKFDHDYEYGDIVVIEGAKEIIIKRVMGLPGDIIDIVKIEDEFKFERNGQLIEEDYLKLNYNLSEERVVNGMGSVYDKLQLLKTRKPELFENDKLIVPENEIFVLGDNREVSSDSAINGPYSMSDVMGIVEDIRYYGEGEFEYVADYVLNGKFFKTIINMF